MVHSTVDAGAASTGLSRTASVPKHAMATNALKPKMATGLSLVLREFVVIALPPRLSDITQIAPIPAGANIRHIV
jgi:hypothetical protein